MRSRSPHCRRSTTSPEAVVDLHNNTGRNPEYGVGVLVNAARLGVTSIFASRYVHTSIPLGALMEAFGPEVAVVTIECGKVLDPVADARHAPVRLARDPPAKRSGRGVCRSGPCRGCHNGKIKIDGIKWTDVRSDPLNTELQPYMIHGIWAFFVNGFVLAPTLGLVLGLTLTNGRRRKWDIDRVELDQKLKLIRTQRAELTGSPVANVDTFRG